MAASRIPHYVGDDRNAGELVKDMSRLASTLVRQEIELAKAEMAEKGRKAALGTALLGGAAIAGLLTLGTLTALLVLLFDLAIPAWAAAVVVTALWAGTTGVLGLYGRDKLQGLGRPMPEKTVDSVKEDVRWLKDLT